MLLYSRQSLCYAMRVPRKQPGFSFPSVRIPLFAYLVLVMASFRALGHIHIYVVHMLYPAGTNTSSDGIVSYLCSSQTWTFLRVSKRVLRMEKRPERYSVSRSQPNSYALIYTSILSRQCRQPLQRISRDVSATLDILSALQLAGEEALAMQI